MKNFLIVILCSIWIETIFTSQNTSQNTLKAPPSKQSLNTSSNSEASIDISTNIPRPIYKSPSRAKLLIDRESNPIFSRKYKLITKPGLSLVASFLSNLYSIPKIQAAFYFEANLLLSKFSNPADQISAVKTSLIISTALIFTHMRLSRNPLDLDPFYNNLFRFEDWGTTSCYKSVAFPIFFLEKMPRRIASLFNIECPLILTNDSFSTIANVITSAFLSREYLNITEVLIINLPRFKKKSLDNDTALSNDCFQKKVSIEIEIRVNNTNYILVGLTYFDLESKTFKSLSRDFGNFKAYTMIDSDSQVEENFIHFPRDKIDDTKSVLIFYSRADTVTQINRDVIANYEDIPDNVRITYDNFMFYEYPAELQNFSKSDKTENISSHNIALNIFNDNLSSDDNSLKITETTDEITEITETTKINEIDDDLEKLIDLFLDPDSIEEANTENPTESVFSVANSTNQIENNLFEKYAIQHPTFKVLEYPLLKASVEGRTLESLSKTDSIDLMSLTTPNIHDLSMESSLVPERGFYVNFSAQMKLNESNSYISALLMAFYNIPEFQKAVYKDASEELKIQRKQFTMNIAIAVAFAQMNTKSEIIDAELYLVEAISNQFKGEAVSGTFISFTDFASNFLKACGNNVKNIFKTECNIKKIKFEDSTVYNTKEETIYFLPIPLKDISRSIYSHLVTDFVNKNNRLKVDDAFGNFEVYESIKIVTNSKYLFFDINRVKYNVNDSSSQEYRIEFDNRAIWINPEIKVNSRKYELAAKIEFDNEKLIYSTIIKDFRTSRIIKFSHDGTIKTLFNVPFSEYFDDKSTFLIYADKKIIYKSYDAPIKIPKNLNFILQQLEPKKDAKRKRETDDAEAEDEVEVVNEGKYPKTSIE